MNALLMALHHKYLLALLSKITIINGITCFSIYYWHYASLLIGTTVYTKFLLALLNECIIIGTTSQVLIGTTK